MSTEPKEYNFQTADSGSALPVGGSNEYFTDTMRLSFERAYFQVIFYSDAEMTNRVVPTAGTVEFQGAISDDKVWKIVDNGVVDATTATDADTPLAAASGPMPHARVVFTDIAGAAYAKAVVVRY